MTQLHTAQELKGLQSQLARAQADASALKTEMAAVQRKHHQANQAVQSLERRIQELQATAVEPIVSEHAILRWLERVEGIDLDAIRAKILSGPTKELIAFSKNGLIKKGGVQLVVRNSVVVTVAGEQ